MLAMTRKGKEVFRKTFKSLTLKAKWLADSQRLPLSKAHYSLYCAIHKLCMHELGTYPHLVRCRDFNDRIQWLKLFDQDREIVRCSDKLGVRERVKERLGDQYLTRIYQVANRFDELRFEDLPSQFVIKTNHDSGTVLVVRHKSKLDHKAAKSRFDQALRRAYGWANGEWAYAYIKPKVFVEEFLGSPETAKRPPDYKFHCCEGRVRWLQYIYDRGVGTKECIVLPDGSVTGLHFDQNMIHSEEFDMPTNWNNLCKAAERLADGFKYARVDLYNIDRRIACGEITFYPLMGCYTSNGQRVLGRLLDFGRTTFKPFLVPTLEAEQSRFSLYSEGL